MKKVLIVSPHFPPINAPDMQRVRLALPYFRELGWEPVVVAVDPDFVEGGVRDPLLLSTYPADIRVIRVKGVPQTLTRRLGFAGLWWRCGGAVQRTCEELLRAEKFDAVFFSTTQFDAFKLGPRWLREFGVPYVVDYQDPWINDYYERTNTKPPGGQMKFAVNQFLARRAEPKVLRDAAGIISVSQTYPKTLAATYPWFDPARVDLLPFGASSKDFDALAGYRPANPLVDFDDGCFHHVYAGRCGPDMSFALSVLFRAFKQYVRTHPEMAERTRFHFIGTDYAPPPLGRNWALPLARAEGVLDYVREHPYRVPYFDALYYLRRANALVAVGSNDPSYSASKIFPYILAARPMLLIFHHNSLVLAFAEQAQVGLRFQFNGPEDIDRLANEVHRRWFVNGDRHLYLPFDAQAFEPYSARSLTAKLVQVFDRGAATAKPKS